MQDKTAEMVLGAVAQGAINAEWDCEINRNLNQIIFIKDVPDHEAYEFRIAYGEETPEELIDTISESIDSEIADAEMPGAKVCFTTTNYHVLRSGMLARRAGLDAEGLASSTKWYFWPNGLAREIVAIFSMYRLPAALVAAAVCAGALLGVL